MHWSTEDTRRAVTRIAACAFAAMLMLPLRVETADAQKKILVYTRNFRTAGGGYVHDNIASGVAAIQKIGKEKGIAVDVSEDPTVFTDANLKQYGALVFANSNNEAFASQDQRDAFKRYIQAGGGFVGIHSSSGSEREWPYFWQVLGGSFVVHPRIQPFKVRVVDSAKAVTDGIPAEFEWTDEFYFVGKLNPGLHPILVSDRTKLLGLEGIKAGKEPGDLSGFAEQTPLAWWQKFDGGRQVYIALGHRKEDYANPILTRLIENGIMFATTK